MKQKLAIAILIALSAISLAACDPAQSARDAASTQSPITTACKIVNGEQSPNCAGAFAGH